MDRRTQLESLVGSLEQLVSLLRLDAGCQWRPHFESSLQMARVFLESGFSQDDLSSFSSSVMSVYGGAGSFGDYAPTVYDRSTGRCSVIPGTESFELLSSRVYDEALSLRVVDHVA
jgi:hypothetical protein